MQLKLVGVGPGGGQTMTQQAARALGWADVVLGAPRLLAAVPKEASAQIIPLSLPDEVAQTIRQHPEWQRVCVALSGDVGFYSGAAKLTELLADLEPELVCGISSPQQFAARLRRPWQDFRLVSAHAGQCDVLAEALNHPAVFFLTGSSLSPGEICRQLTQAGLGDASVTVGENLCTDNEHIRAATARQLAGQGFPPLSIALVENSRTFAREPVSPGIPDDAFIRGGPPMTKREVRVNILARLAVCPCDVLWDVGAGSGSVAVEMALLARRGRVYAVERQADACGLIRQNKQKFGVYNLNVVEGAAPGALGALPPPQAVFVGGSGGALGEILQAALRKNPRARLVASAVTLETLHTATKTMEALCAQNPEVAQIAVNHAVEAGGLHMLRAQNPVFLISGGGA